MNPTVLPTLAPHLNSRLIERLTGIVPDPESLLAAALEYSKSQDYNTSSAMKVAQLDGVKGDPRHYHADRQSNGDEVWVVSRRNKLVTVMFRRSSQSKECRGFDVNTVVDLTTTPAVIHDSTEDVVFRKRPKPVF